MKYIPITFMFLLLINKANSNEFKDYIFKYFISSK